MNIENEGSTIEPPIAGMSLKWNSKDFTNLRWGIYSAPKDKWRYSFTDYFHIYFVDDINWWRRFWVRFFFGGKWEGLNERD